MGKLIKAVCIIVLFSNLVFAQAVPNSQDPDDGAVKAEEARFNKVKREADLLLQSNKYKSALDVYNNFINQNSIEEFTNQAKFKVAEIRELEKKAFNEKSEPLKKLAEKKDFNDSPKICVALKSFMDTFSYEMELSFANDSQNIFCLFNDSYADYWRAQAEEFKTTADFKNTFKSLRNLLRFNASGQINQSVNREIQKIKNSISRRFSLYLASISNKVYDDANRDIDSACAVIINDIKKESCFADFSGMLDKITRDIKEITEIPVSSVRENIRYQKVKSWDDECKQIEVTLGDTSPTKERCQNCVSGKTVCSKCKGAKKVDSNCSGCGGRGGIVCDSCSGRGAVACADCASKGKITCKKCSGAKEFEGKCNYCNGSGYSGKSGARPIACTACNKTGKRKYACNACVDGISACPACGGKGSVKCKKCQNGITKCPVCNSEKPDCPECAALGFIFCNACQGKGYSDASDAETQKLISQYHKVEQNIPVVAVKNNIQDSTEVNNPNANPAGGKNAIAGICLRTYRKNGSDVVLIITESGVGTGFLTKTKGTILTAAHVVSGKKQITIQLFNDKTLKARILSEDKNRDIAVIRVDRNDYQYIMSEGIPLGDSDNVEIGEQVVEIGNSLGLGVSVSDGIISAIKKNKDERLFQTTAPTSPGNSGSPLINSQGECIGIISRQMNKGQNLNFAVPSNYAKKLLDDIK